MWIVFLGMGLGTAWMIFASFYLWDWLDEKLGIR